MALTEAEELELLELEEQEAGGDASQAAPAQAPQSSMVDVAKFAATAPFAQPIQAVKETVQHPESIPAYLPTMGAVGGEIAGGPAGAAVGAGLGQIGKRIGDLAFGNVQPSEAMSPAKESVAPMAQAFAAGLPGTTQGKALTAKVGNTLARYGETLSGAKQDILAQGAKQGYSTYAAPSIPKAQEIFAQALGPEGQAALKPNAADAFDAALGNARKIASDVGTKVENGVPVSAIEALKARQATDRVISGTPVTDKKTLGLLYDWRNKFDSIMGSQSGALADASTKYRQAIVKDTLLNPTRLTKSGKPSAFLPLVLGAGGRTAEGVVQALLGTSPAVWGLGATTVGSITPEIRQAAMSELIRRYSERNKNGQ
jgi:hypothetical protein